MDRRPAEVLVVEGWIGYDGIRSAAEEFKGGDYQYIVTTSGLTTNRWAGNRNSYSVLAEERLLQLGIPREKVILAKPEDAEGHRTFKSAVAVWRVLQARQIHPTAIVVFTFGTHGRRSRLIYEKVFKPPTLVGVISWTPPGYTDDWWWHSSDRATDIIKETIGYVFEKLLNSGRKSNYPATP